MRKSNFLTLVLFVFLLACGLFLTQDADLQNLVSDEMDVKYGVHELNEIKPIDHIAAIDHLLPCKD